MARSERSTPRVFKPLGCVHIDVSTREHPNTYALVDASLGEALSKYSWSVGDGGYAYRSIPGGRVLMHRQIMDAPDGLQVDHKNGRTLDNRRCNLRMAGATENARNRGPNAGRQYKGVHQHPSGGWEARVRSGRAVVYLGYFATIEDAARAYDKGAAVLHGGFAYANFPPVEVSELERADILAKARKGNETQPEPQPIQELSLRVVARVQRSPLSDEYWAKRLRVNVASVRSARKAATLTEAR